jgi:molybdopterin-synthase adenylyltransferase
MRVHWQACGDVYRLRLTTGLSTNASHLGKPNYMHQDQLNLENDRFARQRQIKGFDQGLISSLRIGLIGAGAIGNEVLKNFLLMGVGSVDIYDFDTVEESNLTRSVFLRSSDIGLNKAQAVVARAKELHPNTKLRAISGDIFETLSLSKTLAYDFLFCAVDNFEARLRINEIARITERPWVNCAIDSRNVVVEVYTIPFASKVEIGDEIKANLQHACYACGLPESSYDRIAKRYSCGGLQRAAYLERTVPTTAITASIGAALGVAEAFKLVREMKRVLTQQHEVHSQNSSPQSPVRIFMDSDLPNAQRIELSVNPECPVCSAYGSVPFVADSLPANATGTNVKRAITKPSHSSEAKNDLPYWLNKLINTHQTNGDEPFNDTPIVFSDAIITKAQCKQCGPTEALNSLLGRRAKSVTDSVMVCQQCQGETVQLEFLEMCSILELLNKTITFAPGQPAWLSCGYQYFDRISNVEDNNE